MNNKEYIKYMIAEIDEKEIFYHEAVWAMCIGLIPDDKLVAHKDGNPMNNDIENLYLVDINKEYGDLHKHSNKIFHMSTYDPIFVQKYFNDVYQKIELTRN